ncbi:MAG: hypothetical protein H3C26_12360 [Rhodocyclaceae bacterium]|nr:hypothetical protein [Rhodocyclaceae bacterium]
MKLITQVKKFGNSIAAKVAFAGTSMAVAVESFAQASGLAQAAQTGIDAAKGDGLTVGGYVVAAVAALVVVGVIIGLVKKM